VNSNQKQKRKKHHVTTRHRPGIFREKAFPQGNESQVLQEDRKTLQFGIKPTS
jgi:hypothetical protein